MGGLSDQEIEAIARQIVAGLAGDGPPRPDRPARPSVAGELGVFDHLDAAVRAARDAFIQLSGLGLQKRNVLLAAMRDAMRESRRVMVFRNGDLFDLKLAPLNPELGRYVGSDEGVLVLDKAEGNLPQLKRGDVILSVGGERAGSTSDVVRALMRREAGENVNVEVMRDRKRQALVVVVPEKTSGPIESGSEVLWLN